MRHRSAPTYVRNDVAPLANDSELPLLWCRSFHIHYAISDGSGNGLSGNNLVGREERDRDAAFSAR